MIWTDPELTPFSQMTDEQQQFLVDDPEIAAIMQRRLKEAEVFCIPGLFRAAKITVSHGVIEAQVLRDKPES